MQRRILAASAACAAVLVLTAMPVLSQDEEYPIPEFTEEFLQSEEALETGAAIWEEQCRHCHGSSAYPGKAPKLRPKRYDAAFVYDRVTYGFRKMPAWEDVYSEEERMAVTAYVLSPEFSP